MNIKIEVTRENEDGSADCVLHLDKDALSFLVQEGIEKVLLNVIELYKNKQ
jgi:hypothetical protein